MLWWVTPRSDPARAITIRMAINVAVGCQALANHDSAATPRRLHALVSDTRGYGNTAFGSSALAFSPAGVGNVAVSYGCSIEIPLEEYADGWNR